MIPCRVQFVPLTAPPKKNDQVQKHSETALDTPKKEGTESSFPVKMHLIVLHKACLSVKSRGFTDEVVKMMCAPFVGRFYFYLFSARGTEQAEQPLG